MKTAIYVRISTEDQSVALQEREISLFLQTKGITEYKIYQDEGFRGKNDNRPALKQLLVDCNEGKVEFLVVWKLDRLFRSLRHLMEVLEGFKAKGITFAAVRDQIDLTTPAGILMMQIIGAFAQFESSLISERTKAGMGALKAKGIHMGRKSTITKEQSELVLDLYKQKKSYKYISAKTGLTLGKLQYVIRTTKVLN